MKVQKQECTDKNKKLFEISQVVFCNCSEVLNHLRGLPSFSTSEKLCFFAKIVKNPFKKISKCYTIVQNLYFRRGT